MSDTGQDQLVHDLRGPLASIMGYTDLLRRGAAGPLTAEQDALVEVVARNAARVLTLLDDGFDPGGNPQ